MEKNAIFNIERFSALFSTGLYRIKVSQYGMFGALGAFFAIYIDHISVTGCR